MAVPIPQHVPAYPCRPLPFRFRCCTAGSAETRLPLSPALLARQQLMVGLVGKDRLRTPLPPLYFKD